MAINGGRYSKFQERLKNIVRNRFRFKKKGLNKDETKELISDKGPQIYGVLDEAFVVKRNVNVKNVYATRKNVVKSVDNLKKNSSDIFYKDDNAKQKISGKDNSFNNTAFNDNYTYVSRDEKSVKKKIDDLDLFGLELISKIKDSFNDKLDKLDVLESELYLLSVDQDNALELKKVKEVKEKIEELIKEINDIIDKYNLYNKNYYIEHVIGIDDRIIEDDIIYYRELLDSKSKEKDFVKEYKMLDEFKSLYSRLVVVKHDTEVLREENEEKLRDFDIRDKKYEKIVEEATKISDVQRDCLDKINSQNKYLNELASKINIIDSHEYVTTRLRGLGDLAIESFKFIGLKLMSPLAGIIPSIAINTLMTKKLIGNIYKNLHYEDVKHVYYSTIDYDRELAVKIVDIGYTEDLIDDTLRDIKRLKEDFMLQYNSNILGFSDTLKKINDIESVIYRNQNKVSIIKKRLVQNKKINEDKMIKVRKMNENKN